MDNNQLITLLTAAITAVGGSLITWVVNWLNGKKKASNDNQTIEQTLNGQVLDIIVKSEFEYQDQAKAGLYKQEQALSQIRQLCTTKGVKYDRDYWVMRIPQLLKKLDAYRDIGGSCNE